ncbi:hypothetical protein J6590_094474 [Homalodisca vitripennis]|nr:hypothetical protein J6590_094474 [Homalodisca vitripennis]
MVLKDFVFPRQCTSPFSQSYTTKSWTIFIGNSLIISRIAPNMSPSDYHLFPVMETWLATQRFDSDVELHAGVNQTLKITLTISDWAMCQQNDKHNAASG